MIPGRVINLPSKAEGGDLSFQAVPDGPLNTTIRIFREGCDQAGATVAEFQVSSDTLAGLASQLCVALLAARDAGYQQAKDEFKQWLNS